jgi:hypothetical protein
MIAAQVVQSDPKIYWGEDMMRLPARLLPVLLLGAAPPPLATVPIGAFRTWGIHPGLPLSFVAGGLTVKVEATPCEVPAKNEGCNFDGISNQAIVSVSRPGLPPFRMTSDSQASFVRVAVVRLAAGRGHAGLVVDNQWGGSGGFTAVTVIEPSVSGFHAVPLQYRGSAALIGEVSVFSRSLSRDSQPGFVLEAPGFNFSGECNACTRGVPLVLTIRDGRSVDVSDDPAVRPLFAHDLPAHRRICVSDVKERNGSCAAFVADAARLGQAPSAWHVMLSHYRHEPAGYPAALRSFLVTWGYITPADARALPLA